MLWIRILLTGAVLAAVFFRFGAARLWTGFHVTQVFPLLLGIVLVGPLLLLRAWKWRTLVRTRAPQATLKEALRSYLGALPYSLVTPGKAGEMVRGFFLPHPEAQGLRAAGLTLIDNASDFAAVAWWTLPALAGLGGPSALGTGLAACLLLSGIPAWLRGVRALGSAFPPKGRVARFWNRFWPDATLGWVPALSVVGIGVMCYGVEWSMMHCFLAALGVDIPFRQLAGNLALIQWANSIQVTVAGLGVREGTTAWMLHRSGWDSGPVLAAAFLQTAAALLVPACIGLFLKPSVRLPDWKWRKSKTATLPESDLK